MLLTDWLKTNFTHITLTNVINSKGSILNVPEINVDLTVGLISTDSKEAFAKLCFHYAPVGTIIDEIDSEWYESKVLAVRNMLTKKLLVDPRCKTYLDILERRDKERWSKEQKSTQVKATTNEGISLEFTVVGE